MHRLLPTALLALCAACAAPAPGPAPVTVVPADPPAIQTAAVTPATDTPRPLPPSRRNAPPRQALPPTLSREQIEKTFGHHRRFFDEAYRERLRASPRLSGTLRISFSVNPDGTVQGARVVQSNIGDPALERAVLERIDKMYFPPAAGPTPVERYPLKFSAHTRP